MADQNQSLDLNAFHQEIIDQLGQQFPVFKVVDDYPQDRKVKATPALYLDVEEMEEANKEDPGTGQVALNLRISARIILPAEYPKVGRVVRALAAAVAAFVRLNRFGVPVGPALLVGAYPDHFEPELDQYVVWRVDWQQVGQFGTSVWLEYDEGSAPTTVFAANAPGGVSPPAGDFEQLVP